MSVQAIRALVLAANLLLIGLIGWAAYNTFWYVDFERWEVMPPDLSKFEPPVLQEDERQRQQAAYKVIGRVFDPPPPPAAAVEAAAPRETPVTADPGRLEVLSIQFNPRDPALSSALLKGPLAPNPRFFMPGQDLGLKNLGFEAYAGTVVKAILETEVILTDKQGKEVRLPGPRQAAQTPAPPGAALQGPGGAR